MNLSQLVMSVRSARLPGSPKLCPAVQLSLLHSGKHSFLSTPPVTILYSHGNAEAAGPLGLGVIVSSHRGRMLDYTWITLMLLPNTQAHC